MSLFATLMIGRCRRDSVERRSWLGLAGIGIVAASGLAAYAVCSAFGELRGCVGRDGAGRQGKAATVPEFQALLCGGEIGNGGFSFAPWCFRASGQRLTHEQIHASRRKDVLVSKSMRQNVNS